MVLTLSDAIVMARRNSPRIHEATAMTARAEAGALTAKAYTNPQVEVYEGEQYSRPVKNPGTPGLLQHYAVSQTIEIPTERRARRKAARFGIEGSRAGEQVTVLSVIADAKHAFYNALRQREEIQHAQENLQLVEDLRRRVEVEVRTGEKGRLELTRAEAELARARFEVRSAQLQYANAIANLRVTIAAPPDADIDPQGEFEPRTLLPPLQELRKQVLDAHPLIAESHANTQAAQATLDRERALRIPAPAAFGEFENQPDLRFWRAGVTIPIPLWDRRRGQIADARAAISQANGRLGSTATGIGCGVGACVRAVSASGSAGDLARGGLVTRGGERSGCGEGCLPVWRARHRGGAGRATGAAECAGRSAGRAVRAAVRHGGSGIAGGDYPGREALMKLCNSSLLFFERAHSRSLLLSVAALLVLTVIGCKAKQEAPAAAAQQMNANEVAITPALAENLKFGNPEMTDVTGTLQVAAHVETNAKHIAHVGSPVKGRILKLLVFEGQHVAAGTVLATLHSTDLSDTQFALIKAASQEAWRRRGKNARSSLFKRM